MLVTKCHIRITINININSKLAGTTMGKISFEGVVALKRVSLVSTFRTVDSARLQENAGQLEVVELLHDWRGALLGGKDRTGFFQSHHSHFLPMVVPASLLFIFIFIVALILHTMQSFIKCPILSYVKHNFDTRGFLH